MDDDDVRVLADELIERGDPCGELISLLLARDALADHALPARRRVLDSRIAAYLEHHHDALYGALAPYVQRTSRPDLRTPAMEIGRWVHGFVEVSLRPVPQGDLAWTTRALRAAPIGRFVRRLAIRHGADAAVMHALVDAQFSALRELDFGWSPDARTDPFVGILAPVLPALEVLELRIRSAYVPFIADRLKKLVMWNHIDPPSVRFESRLEAIEHLELADFAFPRGFLRRYPTLRYVSLSGRFDADWVEDFLTSDLGTLETVTLYGTTFHDPDLDVLVRHAARAARLTKLTFAMISHIPVAVLDAARERLPPNVVLR